MQTPEIITIVVHYNSSDECIELIKDYHKIEDINHILLISDNASDEVEFKKLFDFVEQCGYKNLILLRNNFNGGFGYGVNKGVEYAIKEKLNFEFIHVVNCDTKLINKKYLFQLSNLLKENPEIGLVGPAVLFENQQEVQNTILPFTRLSNAINFKKDFSKKSFISENANPVDCEVINGVCFMLRKETFLNSGGFDTDYFMYNEEHDLCMKVKKQGLRIVFYPLSSIIHKGEHIAAEEKLDWRFVFNRRNQVLFIAKNYTFLEAILLAKLFSISAMIKVFKGKKMCISLLKFWINLLKSSFNVVNNEKLLYYCRLKN